MISEDFSASIRRTAEYSASDNVIKFTLDVLEPVYHPENDSLCKIVFPQTVSKTRSCRAIVVPDYYSTAVPAYALMLPERGIKLSALKENISFNGPFSL